MQKIWQVKSEIGAGIRKKYPEYSRVVLQLLFNRGIVEKNEIKEFLEPDCEKLFDPFLFRDMEKAVDLIIKHIKDGNKIVVYGDYDADGVAASALLVEVLEILKAKVDIYIPDRVSEGYGLNKEAVEEIVKKGVNLIITVDGGIRNKEEVKLAKKLGLDVIITDHHIPDNDQLPDCSIVNSHVRGETYPFKNLAGVGVAFKLAKALISKAKLDDDIKIDLEEQILDLVAIGTVADCVSLLGENRILVKRGLEILNNTKRIGLQELIKVAQIDSRNLDSWNIGFQIGPRLNAAGRMEHANTAFELLITKDRKEAGSLAKRLNDRNIERQKITNEIMEKIEKQLEDEQNDKLIIGVCAEEDEAWNEGVIGLVAGRICDRYYLPTLIITKAEDGYKGSGRSVDEFNLIEAIEESREFLDKYGGHPAACGFSLFSKNLDKFISKIKEIANKKLARVKLRPRLEIEKELGLDEVNDNLISEIEKFAPFGEDNPRPKFMSKNMQIRDIMKMGIEGQHIKFRLDSGLWAVAFGQAEELKDLKIGNKIDMVYYAERNEFNGRVEIQLKVVDIRITHNP